MTSEFYAARFSGSGRGTGQRGHVSQRGVTQRCKSQDSITGQPVAGHRRKTRERPITANRSTAHTHTLFISFPHGRRDASAAAARADAAFVKKRQWEEQRRREHEAEREADGSEHGRGLKSTGSIAVLIDPTYVLTDLLSHSPWR